MNGIRLTNGVDISRMTVTQIDNELKKMNEITETDKLISELKTDNFMMGFYCGMLVSAVVFVVSLIAMGKF